MKRVVLGFQIIDRFIKNMINSSFRVYHKPEDYHLHVNTFYPCKTAVNCFAVHLVSAAVPTLSRSLSLSLSECAVRGLSASVLCV